MTKFEKAIYIFWGIAIPGMGIYHFVQSDSEEKLSIIIGICLIALYFIVPFIKGMLVLVERAYYFESFGGITMFIFGAIRNLSLASLLVFITLMLKKFTGEQVVQKLLNFDIFGSSTYNHFLDFLLSHSRDFHMLNFHRTFSWIISILPDPNTTFFYILAVITFILFIFGFLVVEPSINGRKVSLFAMLFDYFFYGFINLLVNHILVWIVITAFVAIVPSFFILAIIIGSASGEETTTVESFSGGSSSSSFPTYLNSSSDNTKTLYYNSSSYSNRATYRDDDGNYIEIIERDGHYYDSSSNDRYY